MSDSRRDNADASLYRRLTETAECLMHDSFNTANGDPVLLAAPLPLDIDLINRRMDGLRGDN